MTARRAIKVGLLLALCWGGDGDRAARAGTQRDQAVAVVNEPLLLALSTPDLTPAERRTLEENVIRGFRFGGFDVRSEGAPLPSSGAPLDTVGSCADAGCRRRIGVAYQVAYLVKASIYAGHITGGHRTYGLRFEAFAGSTGALIADEHTTCDACDQSLAEHLAYLLATKIGGEIGRAISEAGRRADVGRSRAPAAPTPDAQSLPPPRPGLSSAPLATTPSVSSPVMPSSSVLALPSSSPAPSPPSMTEPGHRSGSGFRRALPWIAIGTGALALAGGAVLIDKDGKGTCSLAASARQCPNLYDTKTVGLVTGAFGLLLAGVGIWDLATTTVDESNAAPLQLGLGPRAISLGGTF